jgi:hypothetical protein
MDKKLPPYGYSIYEQLKNNTYPSKYIYLFIGKHAWELASKWTNFAMCLPSYANPNDFFFPVKDKHIAIFNTGLESDLHPGFDDQELEDRYLEDIALALLRDQATQVQVMSPTYECIAVYKKDI